ncbi:hypothetical protein [Kaarinaea lacus]
MLKRITFATALLYGLILINTVDAAPLAPEKVPEPLKPWIEWVSEGKEHKKCPFLYTDFNQTNCAWPQKLEISLNDTGAHFSQRWQIFQDSWITLPGEQRHWPKSVTINKKAALILSRNGLPALHVAPGSYEIAGEFQWHQLPKSLSIPESTALLAVRLNEKNIEFPRIENNRLWLETTQQKKVEDRFELQVFRHIDDAIPAEMTLYLDMQVAGTAREITIDLPIEESFIPLRMSSRLPARLDSNEKLTLQVRPGRWVLQLTLRHAGPLSTLTMVTPDGLWVEQEVWVFSARPNFRVVNISGVTAIDPQQTQLPDAWKRLPAYRLTPGETMNFNEERRGDPEPGHDSLSLQRTLWLSFSGDQYTIQDQIHGVKKSNWRLEMNAPIELGQVTVNGKPQFITQQEGSERSGIEVRQGNIQLTADSTLIDNISKIPALGWAQDFKEVNTTLHLPPGYRVFSVGGADNVSSTWLTRWTLLDIFLVLLIGIAVGKLYSKPLGIVALITLTLIYHESGAPVWVWLFLILGISLLRVLPSGKLRTVVLLYRNITLLALIIVTIPFFIQQIRTSIYPQTESYYRVMPTALNMEKPVPAQQAPQPEASRFRQEQKAITGSSASGPFDSFDEDYSLADSEQRLRVKKARKKAQLELYDPNAMLQTGPGLPQWQWNQLHFSWSGPVDQDQQVNITYIGPLGNALLSWSRVLLVTLLIFGLLQIRFDRDKGINIASLKSLASILLLGTISVSTLFAPESARADIPSKELLQELENRLFAPPECLPQCAGAQTLALELTPNTLSLVLKVNSKESVAIPLPGHASQWIPQKVLINQQRAAGIIKDRSGTLWLPVTKGQHTITMKGLMPTTETVQLALPLKPHYATVKSAGWEVVGIHDDGTIDNQLQFTRLSEKGTEKITEFNANSLPPFVQVQRRLLLGLNWQVETTVQRLSPPGTAVVLQVPLIPGESVTTEGIRVENGNVLVSISANQNRISWASILSMKTDDKTLRSEITLNAPNNTIWSEVWSLDVSPIWHLEYKGIPVIQHQQSNRWLPQWHPWPGEQVTLMLSKPKGVAGQTTTIEFSRLAISPGLRITNATLEIQLRSSQGTQHPLILPENSELLEVTLDNQPIPLRLKERTLMLPVKPGKQFYQIRWQEPHGIATHFDTLAVDISSNSVNHNISLDIPHDRVVLFVGGPTMGPAVLFWGVLIVFLLAAAALARFNHLVPLRYWQWALLSIGLIPISIESAIVVIAWFFIVGLRSRLPHDTSKWKFNLSQLVILGFTFVTIGTLIYAISQGLLGYPNMQVYGNGSNQFALKWYQDINEQILPQAWMVTIPMWTYRVFMLLWALWLAFSIVKWTKWVWASYTTHGYWRSIEWKPKMKTKKPKQFETEAAQKPDSAKEK